MKLLINSWKSLFLLISSLIVAITLMIFSILELEITNMESKTQLVWWPIQPMAVPRRYLQPNAPYYDNRLHDTDVSGAPMQDRFGVQLRVPTSTVSGRILKTPIDDSDGEIDISLQITKWHLSGNLNDLNYRHFLSRKRQYTRRSEQLSPESEIRCYINKYELLTAEICSVNIYDADENINNFRELSFTKADNQSLSVFSDCVFSERRERWHCNFLFHDVSKRAQFSSHLGFKEKPQPPELHALARNQVQFVNGFFVSEEDAAEMGWDVKRATQEQSALRAK